MLKLHTEDEKTKPENPGLEGRLNPGFGFEKTPFTRVFVFDKTRVANPKNHLGRKYANTLTHRPSVLLTHYSLTHAFYTE